MSQSVDGVSPRVLVVMPTYNEIESVPGVLSRIREAVPQVHVLVVDDGSPDGTGAAVDAIAAVDPRVFVLHRTEKAGLGAAYIAGFGWAFEHGYDVVGEMDADGSHLPEQLSRLLDAIEDGADVVLGSRWVRGGAVVNWPWRRVALSRAGSAYARVMCGLSVRDVTGRLPPVRLDRAGGADRGGRREPGVLLPDRPGAAGDPGGAPHRRGPITFVERELGESKMNSSIVREAVVRVAQWGFGRLCARSAARPQPGAAGSVQQPSREPVGP